MKSLVLTPIKGVLTGVGIVLAVVVIVYGYSKIDDIRDARRQRRLDAASTQVLAAGILVSEVDTAQARLTPTREGFGQLISSPGVRNNPKAKEVADTSSKIIAVQDTSIRKLRAANDSLFRAVKNLEDAGPPLGPRLVPYLVAGYSLSNRQRGVPVVGVGADYRLISKFGVRGEVTYEPPPAGVDKPPEFTAKLLGHIKFR